MKPLFLKTTKKALSLFWDKSLHSCGATRIGRSKRPTLPCTTMHAPL